MSVSSLPPLPLPPPSTLPSSLDLSTLTTRAAIEAHLQALSFQESNLDNKLSQLISSRAQLAGHLQALNGLEEVVAGIQGEAEVMADRVGEVAETAERVGGKVRVLDQEQSRVKSSIEVVQAVQDLKSSIASLDAAMQKADWEAATRALQRATAIDEAVVASRFAEAVVPTADLPLAPPQTLSTLRASLLDTFLTSFRTAAAANDTADINRFFKLFPMIGEEDVGLDAYAEWVGGIVRQKTGALTVKSQSPTHFSSLLTSLFESIALIISQHQPVVEKYYGPGKMLAVAARLVSEADAIGLKVLAAWSEERRLATRLSLARETAFPVLKAIARSAPGTRPGEPVVVQDEEKAGLDKREVDGILAEVSMMSGRWQLLRRFLYGRLKEEDDEEDEEPPAPDHQPGDDPPPAPTPPPKEAPAEPSAPSKEDDLTLVEESELGQLLTEQLLTVYRPLEGWYLRSSIEKAHQVDELDLLSQPSLSSSLDDTFYILKKTLYRLVSTGSVQTVVGLGKEIRMMVERDVADVWRARMEGAFRDVNAGGGVGRAREEEKERREREARGVFIIYLNNLDTAADYTARLIDELLAGEALTSSFFLEGETERARLALYGVRGLEDKFRSVLKSGLDHLFNQLLRPRLRPILSDVYKDVTYVLDEDAYAEAEYSNRVQKRFTAAWEQLMAPYRHAMTDANFAAFFATAVNVLVRPWEGMVRGMRFTELGALRLDRDLRGILSWLSERGGVSSGAVRESFGRLGCIAECLTVETVEEAEEVSSAGGNRLTQGEVKAVWALKI